MLRRLQVITFIIALSIKINGSVPIPDYPAGLSPAKQDSITARQLLFNGKIWKSRYSNILGGEFLFSQNWLSGEITISDMTFKNIPLRYDIFNDQLVTMVNQGTFVQLNKELIKGFVLSFENRKYTFENFGNTTNSSKGFAQVLYKGQVTFVLKYSKIIKLLAVENKYDEFNENQVLYLQKDGSFIRIAGKNDLIKALSDKELQIKDYIRKNNIKIRKRDPDSFIRVIKFYDNLK